DLSEVVAPSFPLDGPWRFAGDVVNDAVDAAHLVDDAGGNTAQDIHVEGIEIRGHAVDRGHGPQGADLIIGAAVPHAADRAHWQKHRKRLPDRVVEAGLADLLEIDRIGAPEDVEFFPRDLARDADREPGPRERVAVDKSLGQAELAA